MKLLLGRAAAIFLIAAIVTGCTTGTPPQPRLLTRAAFADLPGWDRADLDAALAAFRRGCALLAAKPADTPMSGAGYAGTAADWLAPCNAADGAARHFFETEFTPFAVGGDDGLFTGYYEPQINGSRTRQGAYQTPVFGLPPDLVRADLGAFSPAFKGEHIAGKLQGQALVPYPDRAAIDAGGIAAAPVLLFTDDPASLFFLQIQGSGRARLDSGEVIRLGYAGDNGQPYTAIGRTLVDQGALTRENVSLQSIRAWLKAHPDQARAVMETDKIYVFFRETALDDASLGGIGTMGVRLTPLASLAVDARSHALGAPFYVAADPAFSGLLIGQDTGGAIRGPLRGDIFFGSGDAAEARAGTMNAPGRMFVLLPNALAARLGNGWPPP